MALNTGDLLSDLDLLAIDQRLLDDFGSTPLEEKRRKAIVDWVSPRVEASGLRTYQHNIRRAPDAAYVRTGGAFTDITERATNAEQDDLYVNSLLVTAATDALYIGLREPFRGLFVSMLDGVNVNTLTALQVKYWDGGQWRTPSSLVDGTIVASSIALSGGGRITWAMPSDWSARVLSTAINSQLYWVRLQVSQAVSNSTAVAQFLPIAQSRLTHPAAEYAVGMVYMEGYGGTRGDWAEKGKWLLAKAEQDLQLALGLIRDEFDVDDDGATERPEVNSVTPSASVTWERG